MPPHGNYNHCELSDDETTKNSDDEEHSSDPQTPRNPLDLDVSELSSNFDPNCDPLIYRLQHQRQYQRRKRGNNNSDSLRTASDKSRFSSGTQDPFDLFDSITSKDFSSRAARLQRLGSYQSLLSEENGSLDDVGWGKRFSESDSDADNDDLVVDFGGITPTSNGRTSRSLGGSDRRAEVVQRSQREPKRRSTISNGVTGLSLVDKLRISSNNLRQLSGSRRGNKTDRRPTQEDLSNILSQLEADPLAELRPPIIVKPESAHNPLEDMKDQQVDSMPSWELSSKSKRRQASPLTSTPSHQNDGQSDDGSPTYSHVKDKRDYAKQNGSLLSSKTPPQPKAQPHYFTEDLHLPQLQSQTVHELRSELCKMQAQSKNNLEKSWAETERLRVEQSKLEDEIEGLKTELDYVPVTLRDGSLRKLPSHSEPSCCSSISSISLATGNGSIRRPASVGRSYRDKVKSYSARAAIALSETFPECSQKDHTGNFDPSLHQSFLGNIVDQSIESRNFDRGLDIDASQNSSHPPFANENNVNETADHPEVLDASSSERSEGSAQSGVIYPQPYNKDEDDRDDVDLVSLQQSMNAIMDDFDFDPLGENENSADHDNKLECQPFFRRRPSMSSLFSENTNDGGEYDTDSSSSSSSQLKENNVATIKSLIAEKEIMIEGLIGSIRGQVEGMRTYEMEIMQAKRELKENEKLSQPHKSGLETLLREAENMNTEIESELDEMEAAEQEAKEKQLALQEELGVIQEKECRMELAICRRQYNASQDNAISTLEHLLRGFDEISIPSLLDETQTDYNLCEDIATKYNDLMDNQEVLFQVLGDADRIASCGASLEQIQHNIEASNMRQNELVELEGKLHNYIHNENDRGICITETSTALLELEFAKFIHLHLQNANEKQGSLILDALHRSTELLNDWNRWFLSGVDLNFLPTSRGPHNGSNLLDASKSAVAMLDEVVSKTSAELVVAKTDIQKKRNEFQARLESVGGGAGYHYRQTDIEELGNEIARNISIIETMLVDRELLYSLSQSHSRGCFNSKAQGIFEDGEQDELEDLEGQIVFASHALSEKESLLIKLSSELDQLHRQTEDEARTMSKMLEETQVKVNHLFLLKSRDGDKEDGRGWDK